MSERYTTVTRTSWLGNIMNSFVGALFGVVIFLLAFVVIWVGEGRTNMAAVAARSVSADAAGPVAANDGKLVAVTGALAGEPLGDPSFLAPGAYLRLERVVEMYAWSEERRTERQDNVGGSSTERTTYSYSTGWTRSPASGEDFYRPEGHRNPPLPVEEATLSAADGRLGGFAVDLAALDLPGASEVRLTPAIVARGGRGRLSGGYLLIGEGSLDSPEVGDVRISYRAVPAGGEVTLFGAQRGAQLVEHRTDAGDVLFRALSGGREAALEQLRVEDTILDWAFRLGALLMLWVGLLMLAGPINAVLGFFPVLKRASGCLFALIMLVPALVLWAIAETVAIIAHNPWLMLALVLLAVGGGFLFVRRRQGAAGPAAA